MSDIHDCLIFAEAELREEEKMKEELVSKGDMDADNLADAGGPEAF